jgi:hypothetical protein
MYNLFHISAFFSRVALVVNGGPLLRPTNALKAYSSPVAYCSDEEVEREFLRLLKNVEDNLEYVKSSAKKPFSLRCSQLGDMRFSARSTRAGLISLGVQFLGAD